MRKSTGAPVVMPPSAPPALFVTGVTVPSTMRYGSLSSLPRRRAASKPRPNSTPLTAGTPNAARAMRFSMPSNMGEPTPAGMPVATHSTTPPTESSSRRASSMVASMALPASASIVGKVRPSVSASSCPCRRTWDAGALSSAHSGSSRTSATLSRWAPTRTPRSASIWSAMPPAAHKGAVSRPEKWPPPGTS